MSAHWAVAAALAFSPLPRIPATHSLPRTLLPIFAAALDDPPPHPALPIVEPEVLPALSEVTEPYDAAADEAVLFAAMVSVGTALALLHASPVEAATAAPAAAAAIAPTASQVFEKAAKRALGGGVSGALAGIFQVLLLMWLRTTMNYQYRNGGSTGEAMNALYAEGGFRRFYQGIRFALVQTPLSRFGDTAANSGVLALLATSDLPIGVRTACASAAASVWRIGLTPVDTMKTTMQVQGAEGMELIKKKVRNAAACTADAWLLLLAHLVVDACTYVHMQHAHACTHATRTFIYSTQA